MWMDLQHAKQNESDRKRHRACNLTCTQNLKCQTSSQRQRTEIGMAREGSGGGVKWMKGVKGTNLTVVK